MPEGGNAVGAALVGVLPHRGLGGRSIQAAGLNIADMFAARLKSYVMFGAIEPAYDVASSAALEALKAADCVVALSPYASAKEFADVILPIGTFAETSGTYINLEGRWQSVPGAAAPVGEARPGWKVLRVLANLLNLPGFDYTSSDQITEEARRQISDAPTFALKSAARTLQSKFALAVATAETRRTDLSGRRDRAPFQRIAEHARRPRSSARAGRVSTVPEFAATLLSFLPQWMQAVVWYGVVALILFISVILMMAFLTLAERRVIGSIQARIGPNRVGPWGFGQPFADVLKLLVKEIVVPSSSSKFLFLIAPLLALIPALAAWAVIPLWPGFAVADINAGVLYLLALSSAGVYGVILAGWAANSKYALLGAMRAAAQMVAYEIAMGFALVGVIMASRSLNLGEIIEAQRGGFLSFLLVLAAAALRRVSSFPVWPKRTARRSTSSKASRKSSPGFTSSTRAWRSPCSSSPST